MPSACPPVAAALDARHQILHRRPLLLSCCSGHGDPSIPVHNGQINDPLEPSQRNLQIKENAGNGIHVENLTDEYVSTVEDINQIMMKEKGNHAFYLDVQLLNHLGEHKEWSDI